MSGERLSALDASFLAVETPTAHMHVGWVAVFSAPADGRLPSFPEIRDHIARRLAYAPRYRQKLASVPLGLYAPEWTDDQAFSVDRHVYWAPGPLDDLVDEVMSIPLRRDRPLWEMWICEDEQDGRVAIVGKTHHCMVDGLAAVQLASLLLDPTPETVAYEPDSWQAAPEPGEEALLARGLRDLLGQPLDLLSWSLGAASAPAPTAKQAVSGAMRVTRALSQLLRAAPTSVLNSQLSPLRRLAWTQRPLAEPADDQARVWNDDQRRDPGGGRGGDAHLPDPPRRAAGGAEGDGAGQRAQRRGRPWQPHLVRVRRAPVPRTGPGRAPLPGARGHDPRQARRRATGSGPGAEGRGTHPGDGAAGALAADGRAPRVQPRGIQHPRSVGADVHARMPAAGRLPGRAAGRSPRRLRRPADGQRPGLLRRVRRPPGAARCGHAGQGHRRRDHRAAREHPAGQRVGRIAADARARGHARRAPSSQGEQRSGVLHDPSQRRHVADIGVSRGRAALRLAAAGGAPAPVPPRPQPVEAPLANTQPIEAPVANGFAGEPRSPGL